MNYVLNTNTKKFENLMSQGMKGLQDAPKEFVLFDLEAVGQDIGDDWMEIIEIGAYKVRIIEEEIPLFALIDFGGEEIRVDYPAQKKVEIIDSYHTYVKPVFHTSISKHLSKLIHMEKNKWADIQTNAPMFDEVIHEFIEWAGKDTVYVSWSSSDEDMIVTNCDVNYIYDLPDISFLDLQFEYDSFKKCPRRTGLGLALEEQNIEFVGEQHTALADTFNMLHLFEKMITEHGIEFTENTTKNNRVAECLA